MFTFFNCCKKSNNETQPEAKIHPIDAHIKGIVLATEDCVQQIANLDDAIFYDNECKIDKTVPQAPEDILSEADIQKKHEREKRLLQLRNDHFERISTLKKIKMNAPISIEEHKLLLILPALNKDPMIKEYSNIIKPSAQKKT